MKEYSFSAVMADWLSFEDNTSLQYNIDVNGVENMPDENVSIWFVTRLNNNLTSADFLPSSLSDTYCTSSSLLFYFLDSMQGKFYNYSALDCINWIWTGV